MIFPEIYIDITIWQVLEKKETIIIGDDISNKFELEELDLGLDITPGSLFQLRLVGEAQVLSFQLLSTAESYNRRVTEHLVHL